MKSVEIRSIFWSVFGHFSRSGFYFSLYTFKYDFIYFYIFIGYTDVSILSLVLYHFGRSLVENWPKITENLFD